MQMHLGVRMYSSKIVDATDPDLFAASIRPVGDFSITERGPFKARSVLFNLGRVYAQRAHESLARIKHSVLLRCGVLFLTEPGPSMFMNGAEIGIDQIAMVNPGDNYTSRLSGATHWGAISLTEEDMDDLSIAGTGYIDHTGGATVFTPPAAALARLRSLHTHMDRLAATAPELLIHTERAHDLEDSLIEAMRATLSSQDWGSNTVGRRRHQIVIDRFRSILEACGDMPLGLAEISQEIGVSGRTLRSACQEQLGVSPKKYIMLRRLRAVRRALQKADPHSVRVTDIATEYGFWELGRFAGQYRYVFGESPGATLRAAKLIHTTGLTRSTRGVHGGHGAGGAMRRWPSPN
jgi:AraC-like DNA-binding protein